MSKAPTAQEREFHRYVRDLGCCVCFKLRRVIQPCDVHHILDGGRRMGEMFVLGLCERHHRGGHNSEWVSRHPFRVLFVQTYGSELDLLLDTHARVKAAGGEFPIPERPASKIVPR